MKKLFQAKYLTMFSFLVLLALMCILGISPVYHAARETAWVFLNRGTLDLTAIEDGYSDNFVGKNHFFALNNIVQNLIGARELNDIYKQDNGRLTYIIGEYDMEEIAEKTIAFRDALQEQGIPMVYVNTPYQIHASDKQLPIGIEDFSNENADRFLEQLVNAQVPTLDLRDSIAEEGLDHYELYFRTDHHWTPEAAFWAAGKITDYLSGLDSSFSADPCLSEPSNYTFTVYEDVFLGSSGRRVGTQYAGLDDLTVITPNFDTRFTFSAKNGEIYREGSFSDAFLDMEKLTSDNILNSSSYSVYCGASYALIQVKNHGIGPEASYTPRKILIIRDSYSDVLIPFLSLAYAETHVIDLRIFDQDLMDYVENYRPDMVLIVYNPGAYEDTNVNMFEFLD